MLRTTVVASARNGAQVRTQPGPDGGLTGTPGGVGDSRDPRRYLRAGETVTVTVGGVGTLANPVTFEQ